MAKPRGGRGTSQARKANTWWASQAVEVLSHLTELLVTECTAFAIWIILTLFGVCGRGQTAYSWNRTRHETGRSAVDRTDRGHSDG